MLRAVSPLIATGILLVITMIGGVLVYNYVVKNLSITHDYGLINIVSAKGIDLGDKTIISIRVANIGTASTEIREVTVYPINITVPVGTRVEPGVTKNINVIVGEKFKPGNYYVIVRHDQGESEPYRLVILD